MFALFANWMYRAESDLMSLDKSCAVPLYGTTPAVERFSCTRASASILVTSAVIFATTSGGILAGPISAYQMEKSKGLSPCSSKVGVLGKSEYRCAVETPS